MQQLGFRHAFMAIAAIGGSFFAPLNAEAQVSLNLIGGADSGAVITNGDFEDISSFTVPSVNVNFLASPGARFFNPADTPGGLPVDEVTEEVIGPDFDIVANSTGSTFEGGGGGTIDADFFTTFVPTDEPQASSGPFTTDDIFQINVFNGFDFSFVEIPSFRIDREGGITGGSSAFGVDNGTGTPLDDGENLSIFQNNGLLSVTTTDTLDLGGTIGVGTTFTLSFDAGVDGANDVISFTPTLTVSDGADFETALVGGALSLTDTTGFTVDGSTATGEGEDLLTTITQTFTITEDIPASQVSLEILFGEATDVDGIDRGAIDNIVLTSEFFEGPPIVTTPPGDFNDDGLVNAADFVVFRDNLGGDDALISNAGIDDGVVDDLDFGVFLANFGAGETPSVLAAAATAVPEPSAVALLLVGAVAGLAGRRRG